MTDSDPKYRLGFPSPPNGNGRHLARGEPRGRLPARGNVAAGLAQGRPFRLVRVLCAAAGMVFVAACGPNEPDPAQVVQHSVAGSEANPLIAEAWISLSRPAHVFVEYDNQLAGRYRTALEPPAEQHTIPIVRLRPETTYDYTVFTVDSPDLLGATRGPGGSFTTGALPDSFSSIFTMTTGSSSQPLILSDHWVTGDSSAHFFFWDEVGALVWYVPVEHHGPVARLAGQENFVFAPRGAFRLRQFTPLAEVADLSGDVGDAHDDLVVLDDGRVLFPIWRDLLHDESASGGPGTTFRYDVLGIWHPATAHVEEMWNAKQAWDILDPAQHREAIVADGIAHWPHVSSVRLGPTGNIVLSLRNRNQVVSLSPDYKIEWQLFGPESDYEFPNPSDQFYRQHTASQLANGNILLFDNGNERPDAEGGEYSRALELRLDDAAGTAVKVWEYRPDPDIYAHVAGSAYRLTNGNTLVNFGARKMGPLVVVEVDASGDEVFRAETVEFRGDPVRHRAYGGIKAIRGETMLRPPAAPSRSLEERSVARYQGMTQLIDGIFDVYLGDGWLVYAKEPCEAEDIALRFLLHIYPKELDDLTTERRSFGFDNMDFTFLRRGALWQGRCHAELRLPEYAIDRIRIGQFVAEGEAADSRERPDGSPAPALWRVEIPLTP